VGGDAVTFATVGAVVSTTMFFALASAPAVPVPVGSVVTASLAAMSRIVGIERRIVMAFKAARPDRRK